MSTPDSIDLAGLLRELSAATPAITDRIIGRIRTNIPSYRTVPRSQLVASIGQIIALVGPVVSSGSVPAPDDIEQARVSSAARARQDIPIQDIMRAFSYTIGGIHETLLQLAMPSRFPPAELVHVTDVLWRFSDAYATSQVSALQSAELDRALNRLRQTQQFIWGLAEGTDGGVNWRQSAVELGLQPDLAYAAVRARADNPVNAERLRLKLDAVTRTRGGHALFAAVGHDVLGVSDRIPDQVEPSQLIIVGHFAALDSVRSSFEAAELGRVAAEALGRTGVTRVEELSWRMAAVDMPHVNRLLDGIYLDVLRKEGVFGKLIEDTLRAYLRHDRNVPRAARSIPVHVNTLRYRLRRFEELTGRSLESTDTIVELAWALEITARLRDSAAREGSDI